MRHGTIPVVGFAACAVLTLWMWRNQGALPHGVGEVEALRVPVAAAAGGILQAPPEGPLTVFQRVQPKQELGRLDDRLVRAKLETIKKELNQAEQELVAAKDKLSVDERVRANSHYAEGARLRYEVEQRRLTVMEHQLLVETGRLESQRLAARLAELKKLFEKKMVSELEIGQARMQLDEVDQRLAENKKLVTEAESQQKEAEARLKQHPALVEADVDKEMAGIVAAADVQKQRIKEVNVEIDLLKILAPDAVTSDGGSSGPWTVAAIHRLPGESVRAGDPIVTLAAERGRYIVSYVRQWQHVEPSKDMDVDVRVRAPTARPVTTKVERVGPQVEPVPVEMCRDPRVPEWGLPVFIRIPADFKGRPGQLLDVTFKPNGNKEG
jgi:multidrug resistance efflux pump